MGTTDSRVTVIILNWNGGDEVIGCIEHVIGQSHDAIDITIVDNGSVDSSCETIRRRFPGITVVENGRNLGFAAGMNQGIDLAEDDYILLLNQDAWIRQDFLRNALEVMHSDPHVGMVGGRLYKLDSGQKTDQLVGGGLLLRRRVQLVGDPDVSAVHYTFSPTWCCPFLRKAMLNDVKISSGHYFDSRYFAYGEDLDLALRAQLRGWKCLFSPDIVAWHSHSGSLGGQVRIWQKPPIFRRHTLRNRYTTIIKDLPAPMLIYLMPFLMLAELAVWPYFLVRSPYTLVCLLQAGAETLRGLPETLRLRRRVQTTRLVSATYLKRSLMGY
jgi:GT2 family glycosyltransferase